MQSCRTLSFILFFIAGNLYPYTMGPQTIILLQIISQTENRRTVMMNWYNSESCLEECQFETAEVITLQIGANF